MSVNDDLYNRAVRHLIGLERVYNKLDRDVQRALDAHADRLQAIVQKPISRAQMEAQIRTQIRRTYRSLDGKVSSDVFNIGKNEIRFQANNISTSLGALGEANRASTSGLKGYLSSLSLSPEGSDITRDWNFSRWLRGVEASELKAVTANVRAGFIAGQTPERIANRLVEAGGGLTRSKADARALVRTYFTRMQNKTTEMTYEANSDILDGYQWISTLDTRTSPICRGRDGRVFKVGSGILPPAHFRCRSSTIPVVKAYESLPFPRRRLDKLAPGRRASFNGTAAAVTNYDNWLRQQPNEVQNELLGEARAEIFRKGNVSLSKFTDLYGSPTSLGALQQLDNRVLDGNILAPYTPGEDVRLYDIKTNVSNIGQLLDNRSELLTFISAQSKIANTPFSTVNFSPAYKRWLRDPANNPEPGLVRDAVTGEVVVNTRLRFDNNTFRNEQRLLDEAELSTKEKQFIRDIISELGTELEDNQRLAVMRTLRLALVRKDFNPDTADINRYLVGQLNSHSSNLTTTQLVRYSERELARRGAALSLQEVSDSTATRTRLIRNARARFDTFAARNVDEFIDIIPPQLRGQAESIISETLDYAIRNAGTDAALISARIGDRLLPDAPLRQRAQIGQQFLNRFVETGRFTYARVVRRVNANERVTDIEKFRGETKDVSIIVFELGDDADFLRYKDLVDDQRRFENLPTTPGSTDRISSGNTDVYLGDATSYFPGRTVNASSAADINAQNQLGYTTNQALIRWAEFDINSGNGVIDVSDTQSLNKARRAIDTANIQGTRTFALNNKYDTRERMYTVSPYLDPQGTSLDRSFIDFKRKVPLGKEGERELLRGAGGYIRGSGNTNESIEITSRTFRNRLVRLGEDIYEGNLENLYGRHTWLKSNVKADDIPLVVRYSLEFYEIDRWINPSAYQLNSRPRTIETYRSSLVNHKDNTASAVQHTSAMVRSRELAALSNVVDTDEALRPYTQVGLAAQDSIKRQLNQFDNPAIGRAFTGLSEAQVTKVAKHPTMTTVYGAKDRTKFRQARVALERELKDDPELLNLIQNASNDDLLRIGRAITTSIETEVPELHALYNFWRDVASAVGGPMRYRTPDGATIIQSQRKSILRELEQDFGGTITTSRFNEVVDEYNTQAISSASVANFIHSFDASLNKEILRRARREGIDVTPIHDSWGTHLGTTERLQEIAKEAFADIYRDNPLIGVLQQLRANGQLTEDQLQDFLNRLTRGETVGGKLVVIDPRQGNLIIDDVLSSQYFTAW